MHTNSYPGHRRKPVFVDRICPVCNKQHRRLGSFCRKHEGLLHTTGSPTGRIVKHNELDAYRPEVAMMLNRWSDHEAIVAGLDLMHELLHTYGLDCDAATTGRAARPYLNRLLKGGGDARSCLIEMASLAFYWGTHGGGWPSPAEQDMVFATRLLLSKRTGNSTSSWRRTVIAGLGYRIRTDLGPLLLQLFVVWKRTEDTRDQRRKTAATFAP